ncbi:acyltransferase [Chitinophaga sp. HK235]|uniref:acyltransferase family protein n=1 Tax=Chitinophaga sp. HK235 TaxID=2952571 RepID=UPI001BA7A592|nr:acyltransferase [Chitinophaga sp. HK235]
MQQIIPASGGINPAPAATTSTPKSKTFLNYIHHFRGIAILYVVAAHPLLQWAEGSPVERILNIIFQNSTVMFIFIAGYLFQHLSAKFEYKDYLVKKLQGVICPYILLSIPIIVARLISGNVPGNTLDVYPDFASFPAWKQIGYYLLHGAHMQPFWFIPMITLYYLGAPVLIYIDRHPRWYWVLLPLFVVSTVLVQRAALADTFRMAIHFLFVYLFGMFLSHYKDRYLEFAKKYWLPITVLSFLSLAVNFYVPARFYDPADFTQKILFSCFYIYWLWKLERYVPKVINILATLSFGIFFIHYFFVLLQRFVSYKIYGHEMPGNLFSWALCNLFVLVPTVLFLMAARKVFGKYSKYFVGC